MRYTLTAVATDSPNVAPGTGKLVQGSRQRAAHDFHQNAASRQRSWRDSRFPLARLCGLRSLQNSVAIGFVAVTLAGSGYAASYSYADVKDPLAPNATYAIDVNDAGAVTGYYRAGGQYHGFADVGGVFTSLDDPLAGAGGTLALGNNNAGQVIGYYYDHQNNPHGFLNSGGVYSKIDVPQATFGTVPLGINNAGEITGYYYDNSGEKGFLYFGGVYTILSDPASPNHTVAQDTNGSGKTVGYFATGGGYRSYTEVGGVYSNFDDPLAMPFATLGQGVNASGTVSGYFYSSPAMAHGFVETGGVFTSLDDPLALPGSTYGFHLNNAGSVAGIYYDAAGAHGFVASLPVGVPEPSTWLTFLIGAACLGFALRKQGAVHSGISRMPEPRGSA